MPSNHFKFAVLHVRTCILALKQSVKTSLVPRLFFHTWRGKILVNGQFQFYSLKFKNWWCNIHVLCDVILSLKSCKETACCGYHFLWVFRAKERRFSKREAFVSLCRVTLVYLTFETQELYTAVGKLRNTHYPLTILPLVHSLAHLVFCILPQPSSFLWSLLCSTWCHSHEAIWLEWQHHGAWIESVIGHWPGQLEKQGTGNRSRNCAKTTQTLGYLLHK